MNTHTSINVHDHRRLRHFVCIVLLTVCVFVVSAPTYAHGANQKYRNQKGTVLLGVGLGVLVGSGGSTSLGVGANVGYAVFHGVVPGVRALTFFGGNFIAETAATLTLTPPMKTYVVPYLDLELGGRFDNIGNGVLYGGGLGVFLGRISAKYALKLGYLYRKINYGDGLLVNDSRPSLSIALTF